MSSAGVGIDRRRAHRARPGARRPTPTIRTRTIHSTPQSGSDPWATSPHGRAHGDRASWMARRVHRDGVALFGPTNGPTHRRRRSRVPPPRLRGGAGRGLHAAFGRSPEHGCTSATSWSTARRWRSPTGNLVYVQDVLDRYPPGALRLLILSRPGPSRGSSKRPTWTGGGGARAAVALRRRRGDREAAEHEVAMALLDDLDVPPPDWSSPKTQVARFCEILVSLLGLSEAQGPSPRLQRASSFYASAPRERAVTLQRHARTLHAAADKWATGGSVHRVGTESVRRRRGSQRRGCAAARRCPLHGGGRQAGRAGGPDGASCASESTSLDPGVRQDSCTRRTEIVNRAADLCSESAGLVNDNERRWRVFRQRVVDIASCSPARRAQRRINGSAPVGGGGEAERVAARIEQHPPGLTRLIVGHGAAELDALLRRACRCRRPRGRSGTASCRWGSATRAPRSRRPCRSRWRRRPGR